jgi:hypothetical protein
MLPGEITGAFLFWSDGAGFSLPEESADPPPP